MPLAPYKTPNQPSKTEFTVNKSRFIGRCYPVADEQEALELIKEIRDLHSDATHNCWAYNLRGGVMRFSDDGEPGGTAGMPIMDTLLRSNTQDALIIVTRYFGGILLGSGGLVRAYGRSANAALNGSGTVAMRPGCVIEFSVDYTRYGALEGFVRSNSVVKSVEFLESVRFSCLVPAENAETFLADIIERTDGRSKPAIVGEEYLRIQGK